MPGLFNKKIVNNRLNTYKIDNIEEKVETIKGWQKNLSRIKGLNEVNLQNAFLKAIFENILGYENAPQKDQWTLDIEATTDVDATRPDGIIGFYKWDNNDNEIKDHRAVIELKGPQIALDKDQERAGTKYKSPVDQGFSYTNKLDKCQWVIVSNFVEIRLYQVGRSKEYYETFYLHELDDPEEFKRFYFLLNKENLINKTGKSTTFKLTESTQKRHEDISVEFYNLYKDTRVTLFEYLKEDNPEVNQEILLEKAQKFLDRIIFICFCEDKSLLPNDLLHQAIERGKDSFDPSDTPIWNQIRGVFKSVDKGNPKHNINAFNGGLFEDDEILDSLKIRDEFFDVIYNISDYDFDSDVDVNILGHIFEQSITDIEKLKSDIKEDEFDKDESRRKKDGIYYTPQYITKYIVENAIGGYLDDIKEELGYYQLPDIEDAGSKSWQSRYTKQHLEFYDKYEEELKDIKVLDPACGSGAFLNQAFDYLLDEHHWLNNQRDLLKTSLKSDVQQGMQISLSSQERIYKDILNNNIFGVDLNEESVEITKLSLWLKTANKHEALTNLDDNIRCGNSLIDAPEIAGDKAFNWEEEFSEIMEAGGFDVVVGNPPYVFARNQSFDQKEKNYYYSKFDLNSYQLNTFVLFIEKGIKLLNETGWFGYIIPNNWLTINSFKKLRGYILRKMKSIKVVNTHDDVFSDANVDSCISIWSKKGENIVEVGEYNTTFKDLVEVNPEFFLENENHIINISMAKKKNLKVILRKIENISNNNLQDIANVVSGLKAYETGKGTPPQTDIMKNQRVYHSYKKIDNSYYKYLEGRDVKRYFLDWSKEYLKYGDCLAAPREFKKFSTPRILIRQIPSKPPYCINGIYVEKEFLNDINSMIIYDFNDEINPLYILGLLNSRLISFWFEYTFDKFQRDIYPQFKVNELEKFPVKTNISEKIKITIKNKVEKIIANKNKLNNLECRIFDDIRVKYSSAVGDSVKGIIKKSNFLNKIYSGRASKVRNFTVDINANIVTLYSDKSGSGKYELLKFEENDKFKRKYIKYYLENLSEDKREEINDKYSGNLLKKVLQIGIPDYDKEHVVKKVVQEWEDLQDNIEGLKRQIEKTDKDIDQMVYALYDLTDEEIEIVENSLD